MPFTAVIFGVILIVVGVAGYVHGMMNEKASITALIPAFFGVVLAALGAAANASEGLRKHLMHAAVTVALIGFILTAGRLASKFSELTMSAAVISQIAMASICLIYVILSIRSFIAARAADKV
ncbi:MAG: hypothetical protein K1X36_02890 [Pyrinomonadaceae bacterium]|nr:hypothetical protein [Pyrinomonadaceae bacterium]